MYLPFGLSICPNLNCPLSINRIDAGCSLFFAISLMHFTPDSKFGNRIEPYFRHLGNGLTLIVTSVMTPKLPSEPNTMWLKSGPQLIRGT